MNTISIAPLGATNGKKNGIDWSRIWRPSWFQAFLLIALFLIAYIVKQANDMATAVPKALTAAAALVMPPPNTVEVDRIAMVQALQQKFEVTTFSMTLEKNFTGGNYRDEDWWWQRVQEYGITLLVPAKINAGFYWDKVKPDQITVTHDTVVVDLGPPKVLDVVIDPARVKRVASTQGNLAKRDEQVTLDILAAAKVRFRSDACTNDILKKAAVSAETQVGTFLQELLRAAGDKRTVKVVTQSPSC